VDDIVPGDCEYRSFVKATLAIKRPRLDKLGRFCQALMPLAGYGQGLTSLLELVLNNVATGVNYASC